MKADFKDSHPQPPGQRRGGNREQKRPNSKRGATANKAGHAGWAWLIAGVLIGLFGAFVWYLNQHAPTRTPTPSAAAPAPAASLDTAEPSTIVPRAEPSTVLPKQSQPPAPAAKPAEPSEAAPATPAAPAEPPAPDWRFYQLLEEQKVEVPVEHIRAPRAEKAPDPNQRMLLQVGSFRNLNDAERMKAELALKGYEADIVATESQQNGTWHRVRLGPYDDPRKLAKDRAKLFSQNIQSLPIKISP